MAKREFESIREFLRSRYPCHPQFEDVGNLEKAGFTKLDELHSLELDRLAMYVPHLFCLALRAHVKRGGPDPVLANCTRTMNLAHTRKTVKLREENNIPQLPAQYNPMFDPIPVDASEPPELNPAAGVDEDELSLLDAADLKLPDEPGLLELEMILFERPAALQSIWCSCSGSKMLVRKDYIAVQEQVQALWNAGIKAVLLLGVPGIGKTGFIIFMLLYLIEQRKPVVFRTKGGSYYFFEPQAPAEQPVCYKLQDNSILLDPEVYLLADGKLPDVPEFGGNALLASIPKLANYQDFGRDGRSAKVLLPVWYAAEIALAWQEIHDPKLQPRVAGQLVIQAQQLRARQALTLEVVKDRYRKWGGTARFVLAEPHVDLDGIIEGLQSIQATVEAVSKQLADGDHPSHKLVHMKVRPGYSKYEYMFASPYVAQAARRRLKQTTSESLRMFLSFRGLDAHGANGLKGIIFRDEFKHIARERKTFKVREVFQDINAQASEQDMVFEFGEPLDVADLATLPFPPPVNRMIWPASRIEETVDAMRIVQKSGKQELLELHLATISSGRHEHGLNYSAVLAVMKKFRIPPSRTIVYIETTAELYPKAGYQNWRRSCNLVLKDTRILKKLQGIRQYVLHSKISG